MEHEPKEVLKVAEGNLGVAERARLVSRYGRPFVSGEVLFREGDPAAEAFLLEDGRVRLLKCIRMVERSLRVLQSGDLFGESALVQGCARSCTAVALTPGVALAFDRQAFRALLAKHPSVATSVTERLLMRLRDAEDQIEIMLLRDDQQKIVCALLKLAERAGAGNSTELPLSPVDLAARVGLDVDTVKRNVQRLRDQQYVRIEGERTLLPDLDALRRLYVLLGTKSELQGERHA